MTNGFDRLDEIVGVARNTPPNLAAEDLTNWAVAAG